MSIILDDVFKDTVKDVMGRDISEVTDVDFRKKLLSFEPTQVGACANFIKTAHTLGMSYSECLDEYFGMSNNITADDEAILACLIPVYMLNIGDETINDVIKIPRDINIEAAAIKFGVPQSKVTAYMLDSLQDATDKFNQKEDPTHIDQVESWDRYFYEVCRQVARNSKCFSRRLGTVMVKDKSIVSTGYNGPPRGVPTCDQRWEIDEEFIFAHSDKVKDVSKTGKCPRKLLGYVSGKGLSLCPAGHSERNTLINAARNGICTHGATLYMTCEIPCKECLVEIINAGISEIVVTSLKIYDEASMYILKNSDLKVRLFDFI